MAKSDKVWHPDFLEYMESIVGHPHYSGLPIKRKYSKNGGYYYDFENDTFFVRKKIK